MVMGTSIRLYNSAHYHTAGHVYAVCRMPECFFLFFFFCVVTGRKGLAILALVRASQLLKARSTETVLRLSPMCLTVPRSKCGPTV